MNTIIEKMMGIDTLSDQLIAMDLLMAAKSGMKMYAAAATESATPQLRETFRKHLLEAVESHAKITEYMMRRGFYHPYNMAEQIRLDRSQAQTALQLS